MNWKQKIGFEPVRPLDNQPSDKTDVAKAIEALKRIDNFNSLPIHPWHVSIITSEIERLSAVQKDVECWIYNANELQKAFNIQEKKLNTMTADVRVKDELIGQCILFLNDYVRHTTHPGVSRLVSDLQDSITPTAKALK